MRIRDHTICHNVNSLYSAAPQRGSVLGVALRAPVKQAHHAGFTSGAAPAENETGTLRVQAEN